MDLSVFFAGTAGSVPTARRGLPALLVRRGGDRLLFDCGEGTQRQLLATVGLPDVGAVFLTHLFVNAGMNLGLLPITGIPMPFVSAAASYLLVSMVAVGLAQSIAVRRRGFVDQSAGVMLFE